MFARVASFGISEEIRGKADGSGRVRGRLAVGQVGAWGCRQRRSLHFLQLVTEPALTSAPNAPVSHAEPCWRCGTAMEWRHATLQCPRCHFKIGCCEGPTAECSPQDR